MSKAAAPLLYGLVLICCFGLSSGVLADTYHVKAGTGGTAGLSWADAFSTLQEALNAAGSGDQIWVAAGTYLPTYDYELGIGVRGKHFRMKNGLAIYGGFTATGNPGWNDRDPDTYETILSGDLNQDDPLGGVPVDNAYHVFYHPSGLGLDATAVLDGVTITAGNAEGTGDHMHGGGMFNDTNSPSVIHCVFSNNNTAFDTDSCGGGLYCLSAGITVTDCTFTQNSADEGGGISIRNCSNVTISNCRFINNSALNYGGGVSHYNSMSTVTNCYFHDNIVTFGGAMSNLQFSYVKVVNCIFTSNLANYGGCISNISSSNTIINCIFSGNTANEFGGGIYNNDADSMIYNSTFSNNSADSVGGGTSSWSSYPTFANCIFWNNTAPADPQIHDGTYCTSIVSYSDLQGGHTGTGNIIANPQFIDADGPDNIIGTEDDNLRLNTGSACIDAADNTVLGPDITTDPDGRSRYLDDAMTPDTGNGTAPIIDMGAYEYGVLVMYVNSTATGNNDGSSWEHAFTSLQAALDQPHTSALSDQIWVTAGIYTPTTEVGGTGDRYKTFQMENSLEIYGGFAATGNPGWNDRDPDTYTTILSGDLGIIGDYGDNCYHVLYHPTGSNLDPSAVLDGFIITAGNANGPGEHSYGGGMANSTGNPKISNCLFTNNLAYAGGAGMYNESNSDPTLTDCTLMNNWSNNGGAMYNSSSDPVLEDCDFIGNSAYTGGGAINNDAYSNPTLSGCLFEGNWANEGGAIRNYDSSPTMTDCAFAGNSAYQNGGGIENVFHSNPTLTNCSFSSNLAGDQGGGMDNYAGSPTITNCSFTANETPGTGGGLYNEFNSNPIITNCIFWSNTAPADPQIGSGLLSFPQVSYCDVQDGYTGTGNIDTDPLFVDPDGLDNTTGTADDNLHLKSWSPCINAGDPSGNYTGLKDIDGQARVLYDAADIGIDEVWPIAGDLEPDGDVDIDDFDMFTGYWLNGCSGPLWCGGGDIDQSGTVDITDYTLLASHWLAGTD